ELDQISQRRRLQIAGEGHGEPSSASQSVDRVPRKTQNSGSQKTGPCGSNFVNDDFTERAHPLWARLGRWLQAPGGRALRIKPPAERFPTLVLSEAGHFRAPAAADFRASSPSAGTGPRRHLLGADARSRACEG